MSNPLQNKNANKKSARKSSTKTSLNYLTTSKVMNKSVQDTSSTKKKKESEKYTTSAQLNSHKNGYSTNSINMNTSTFGKKACATYP